MSPATATWGLLVVSVFGLWLTGQRPMWGWRFALANQLLVWLPWAIWARQPGLVAQGVIFTAIYARNLRRWRNGSMTLEAHRNDRQPVIPPQARHDRQAAA